MKRIRFTKAPTFTKGIIAAAIFAAIYLASTSNLPSCSDTAAVLNGNGECIERQSFLHTASGWLALICVVLAVLLLALKHKDAILGRPSPAQQSPAQQAYQGPPAPASMRVPVTVPGRASGFCAKCGTRFIPGDRFCQGCGVTMGGNE